MGTENKGKLGANMLAVSLAVTKAATLETNLPLYRASIRRNRYQVLPIPMMNILNGGARTDNKIDFRRFMVMPVGAKTFSEVCNGVLRCFTPSNRC